MNPPQPPRKPETGNRKPLIAIHDSDKGFHPRWIDYCERQGIPYRLVDCYASDIIEQVKGCQALMWHHGQSNPKDVLIARPILSALEHAGIKVFPDFRTAWHFDDKVAQKYLFEALDIPAVPAHIFVDREHALAWVEQAEFPKVFKLRRGAGSHGVRLAKTRSEGRKLVKRAFGRGFPQYAPWNILKERIYKYRQGQASLSGILRSLVRFVHPPPFSRILGRERGYAYFQDFLPGNDCDIRIVVIGQRAFAIRRLVRPGDFRASGSGRITYQREDFDERCVELAFEIAEKLGSDCTALDFVFDENDQPWILEASYGFVKEVYDPCTGYWDADLNWHPGPIRPQDWIIERILDQGNEEHGS